MVLYPSCWASQCSERTGLGQAPARMRRSTTAWDARRCAGSELERKHGSRQSDGWTGLLPGELGRSVGGAGLAEDKGGRTAVT